MTKTIANSVLSERNFSLMKLIHSLIRNRLTSKHVNKLLFIYINNRVLNRVLSDCLDDDEELEIVEELEGDGPVTVENS